MNRQINLQEIIDFLGSNAIKVTGNVENIFVRHLKPVESVDAETLDWIGIQRDNKQSAAEQSKAKAIICDESVIFNQTIKNQHKVLIHVLNPRMSLSLLADRFFISKPASGISRMSEIHPESQIADSVYIGANCTIGNCIIGEGTRVYPNVTIYDGIKIGKNVIIQAGTVIGTDGLGCERLADGKLIKFPHIGNVEIGDDVEIGANCQIARGALSNTIIGNGCKINGLCFIAHNCILGENVWITGSTMLSGSVKVENNVNIFSKVIIREQCTIGQGATIGMGAVVTKNIPAGETWIGNPAKKMEK